MHGCIIIKIIVIIIIAIIAMPMFFVFAAICRPIFF